MSVILICKSCNDEYTVPLSRVKRSKYCSKACFNDALSKRMKGNRYATGRGPNQTSFKRGHTPWNKVLKGIHLSPHSEYKLGRKNENKMSIGSVTIRTDQQKKKRRWIKMPDGWIEFAKIVWAEAHGPIPEGMLIHHKDRNTLNDNLDNLQLMDRADHLNEHRAEIVAGRQSS